MKLVSAAKTMGCVVAIGYVYFTEARIRNLQALTNLAYDVSACSNVDSSRAAIDKCFSGFGYQARKLDSIVDRVDVPLLFDGWSFRSYWVYIEYGKDGKLLRCSLQSGIANV